VILPVTTNSVTSVIITGIDSLQVIGGGGLNPYANEEVMWQRLKDVQLEAENRRLLGVTPSVPAVALSLARKLWGLARMAMPRSSPAIDSDDQPAVSDVA
jgi:hypothetical protein